MGAPMHHSLTQQSMHDMSLMLPSQYGVDCRLSLLLPHFLLNTVVVFIASVCCCF